MLGDNKNKTKNNAEFCGEGDVYPLSPGQFSLWFVDKVSPGKGSYNLHYA